MTPGSCQGAGLGLRMPHLHDILNQRPPVDWFEVHACNFLGGGRNRELLRRVAEHYPLSFHGVNLNLGGIDPLNEEYLTQLRDTVAEFSPGLVSEHACFTSHGGHHFHDLLPLPFTEEALDHLVERVQVVQEFLGQTILVENLSRYHRYADSCLSEGEFLAALCERSGCGLLLDLNNAYVNQRNLGEPVEQLLAALPLDRVAEIHLAGFSRQGDQLIDTHSTAVCDAVWCLFEATLERLPAIPPCLIEWDSQLPPLSTLVAERNHARELMDHSRRGGKRWAR